MSIEQDKRWQNAWNITGFKMEKKFLFISCEEAKHICDKSQYGEASFWERLKLNMRFCWCRLTRSYVKQNKKLTSMVKDSKVACLKKEEREQLKKQFEDHLNQPH